MNIIIVVVSVLCVFGLVNLVLHFVANKGIEALPLVDEKDCGKEEATREQIQQEMVVKENEITTSKSAVTDILNKL